MRTAPWRRAPAMVYFWRRIGAGKNTEGSREDDDEEVNEADAALRGPGGRGVPVVVDPLGLQEAFLHPPGQASARDAVPVLRLAREPRPRRMCALQFLGLRRTFRAEHEVCLLYT